jgi:hypothetical protein
MKRLCSREYASRRITHVVSKKTPHGRTLEHLTETNLPNDRYRYYHATKGWRDRRAWGVTDHGLRMVRQYAARVA